MDFGTYERFLGFDLTGEASLTGGKIFSHIIEKERRGDFLGEDVQFIPHVTDYIKDYLKAYHKGKDLVVIEVGGTAGDIENAYFLEALRQLALEDKVLFLQLTWLPQLPNGEQKTKPTQQAFKILRSMGISPHIVVARVPERIEESARKKIALYGSVKEEHIFADPDVEILYEMPIILERQGLYRAIAHHLSLEERPADWKEWQKRVERLRRGRPIRVGIVGKYVENKDAYASLYEALKHAGAELGLRPTITLHSAEGLEEDPSPVLEDHLTIIAGGFGSRGIEGKIRAIEERRKAKKPLLGICLGMQLMVVEYARNVLGWRDAHSLEFCSSCRDVITLLPEQKGIRQKGGTMRLGEYEMEIREGTKLHEAYGRRRVKERHRHRYEVNPRYVEELERAGLIPAAFHKHIVEAVEYKDSVGIGLQSHPELSSKWERPNPLFVYMLRKAAEEAGILQG